MKKKVCLILSVFSLLTAGHGFARQSFSLDHAIDAALKYNHGVRLLGIESEKQENSVSRGNAGQLPVLFVSGGVTGAYSDVELTPGSFFLDLIDLPGEGSPQSPPKIEFDGVQSAEIQAGVGTQFTIYDGLKGRLRYRMLETGSELAGLQHRAEMESTILSVTAGYFRVASLQKAIALKEIALEQSRDRYRIVESRREYGQASEQQRLQALADLKSDSTEYRNLHLEYEQAYRNLHQVIGWEKRDLQPVDEETAPPDLPPYDDLLVSLTENNTVLHLRRKRIEHASIGEKMANAQFYPSVTASARYGYNSMHATDGQFESQSQLGVSGGITLRIPIFSGGRNRTAAQNAKASVRQEELRFEESEREFRTRFENLWQEMVHLEDQLVTEQNNLEIYERNYERARDSFRQGLIGGVELRSAQLSLQQLRLRISETRYRINLTASRLLYLSGRLLDRPHDTDK